MNRTDEGARRPRLPRYEEIPGIPLVLDQVLLIANDALSTLPAGVDPLTSSMVNNYVKHGLVDAPLKKRYGRTQVCQLICICMLKQVIGLEETGAFLATQQGDTGFEEVYDGFCSEAEAALLALLPHHFESSTNAVDRRAEDTESLLHSAAQAFAYRSHILEYIQPRQQKEPSQKEKA